MSVRMALAKLCACACGGAVAGGGFVHVVERSQPRPANPVLVKARQPARTAHRARRPVTACAPGTVRTAMRPDPIRYATAPSISGYQVPDGPGGYGGGPGYGGVPGGAAPVFAGGRPNGGYGGGFFGGFFGGVGGGGGGTALASLPAGAGGAIGNGTDFRRRHRRDWRHDDHGGDGDMAGNTSSGGTAGKTSDTNATDTSAADTAGNPTTGDITAGGTPPAGNVTSPTGVTPSADDRAPSRDGSAGGNAAEPVPAPPMILLFGAAVGALVLRRLARKPTEAGSDRA